MVIERPNQKPVLMEIKSASSILDRHLSELKLLEDELPQFERICACQETYPRKVGKIKVLPWKEAIAELGF